MNDEAVCRTAPATPGLLKKHKQASMLGYKFQKAYIGYIYVGWICQMWGAGFVISGWDLSNVGGGLSYMGGVCQIWAGFVTLLCLSLFERDLSQMGGICHRICHKNW